MLNIGVSVEPIYTVLVKCYCCPQSQSFFLALAPPVGKGIIISSERKRIRIKEECANLAGGLFRRESGETCPKLRPLSLGVRTHSGLLIGQVEK